MTRSRAFRRFKPTSGFSGFPRRLGLEGVIRLDQWVSEDLFIMRRVTAITAIRMGAIVVKSRFPNWKPLAETGETEGNGELNPAPFRPLIWMGGGLGSPPDSGGEPPNSPERIES